MLASNKQDQENRVFSHQAGAAAKQQHLQAKTPGARFPKTPLKVPLNDENRSNGVGGKSVLQAKSNNENVMTTGKGAIGLGKSIKGTLVTPGPRTARAPLGNKTTNAKARTLQQTGVGKASGRDVPKTNAKPNSTRRLKHASTQNEALKLEILADKGPLEEEEDEVEYAPPQPKDLPYESDVFPSGVISYDMLKSENMFKGYYQHYFNPVDDSGLSRTERDLKEQRQRAFKEGDEQILRDMDDFDWSVGDVPVSKDYLQRKKDKAAEPPTDKSIAAKRKDKQPPTIASRRAASALAMSSKPSSSILSKSKRPITVTSKGKSSFLPGGNRVSRPVLAKKPSMEQAAALAISRNTLGYTKGRSVSSVVHGCCESSQTSASQPESTENNNTLPRENSTPSLGVDDTITPARLAQKAAENDITRKLSFLSIFDPSEDDDGNFGGPPEFDDDDGFQLQPDF